MPEGSKVVAVNPMFRAVLGPQRSEPGAPASMARREGSDPSLRPVASPRGVPLPAVGSRDPALAAGQKTRGSLWGAAPRRRRSHVREALPLLPAFTSRPENPALRRPGPQAPSSGRLHPLSPGRGAVRLLPPRPRAQPRGGGGRGGKAPDTWGVFLWPGFGTRLRKSHFLSLVVATLAPALWGGGGGGLL